MGVYTFITYLSQHIPDKYFRIVRGYGLFSNRLKGELLPMARVLLNQSDRETKPAPKNWRERTSEHTGRDPLICETCLIEMDLILVYYKPDETWLPGLGIDSYAVIPSKQLKLIDTS